MIGRGVCGDGGRHRGGPSSVQPEELRRREVNGPQTPRRSNFSSAKRVEEKGRQTLRRSKLSLAKREEKREAETEEVQAQFSQECRKEEVV